MKKNDNHGFSLIELIIVIAIMSVLIAVLAPQYLKYVEKSKMELDLNNLTTLVNSVEMTIADPEIEKDTVITAKWDGANYSLLCGEAAGSSSNDVWNSISATMGNNGTLNAKSKVFKNCDVQISFVLSNDHVNWTKHLVNCNTGATYNSSDLSEQLGLIDDTI